MPSLLYRFNYSVFLRVLCVSVVRICFECKGTAPPCPYIHIKSSLYPCDS